MTQKEVTALRLDSVSPEEYAEVVDVWEASVRATHHFVTEGIIQFYRPLILHQFLKEMHLTCVRDEERRIKGFTGVVNDEIEMLFLHPSARGKGIGKKLVQHAIQNSQITKVDVNEENEQALGFYLHLGFEIVSRSPLDSAGMPHPILHMELK